MTDRLAREGRPTSEGNIAKPRRRGRRRAGPSSPVGDPCLREGCDRLTGGSSSYCTGVCRGIATEMERARRVCEAVGSGELTTALWTTIAGIGDAWTQYLQVESELVQAAASVGIDQAAWDAIRHGSS